MSRQDQSEDAAARRPGIARLLKRMILGVALVLLVLFAFFAALVATAPATVLTRILTLPPQIETLAGTLWQGRAGLAQGYALDWRFRPQDLLRLQVGTTLSLTGPDTQIEAEATGNWKQITVSGLRGRAGPGLVALADPGLVCDTRAALDVDTLAWQPGRAQADGRITIDAGTCTRIGQTATLPALQVSLTSEGNDALAQVRDAGGAELGQVRITGDRRAILRMEPAGASLIPGMPSSAATILEYPF